VALVLDVGMVAQPNARQKQQLLVAQVKEESVDKTTETY
jgi:hypothetical protein